MKVISTIQSFLSSWRVSDKNRLYSLAPELPVSIDVENDILGAEDLGQSIKEELSTLCEKCPNTELFLVRIWTLHAVQSTQSWFLYKGKRFAQWKQSARKQNSQSCKES